MRTAVIGLGRQGRDADAVGLVAATRLARLEVDAEVHAWRRPLLDLLDWLPRYDRVVLVGAARAGSPLGTLHHDLDAAADTVSDELGLASVLELAEAMDRLPSDLHFLLVEVGPPSVDCGASAIDDALDDVVQRLGRALRPWRADLSW